ncbi:MAG TPA: SRPBCC domain-containing protein [Nocardioides sp.]|uniref:CoxG family protein n=1 Tax=Nocardioides sp. TaxID=35761 RepID=UPI002D7E6CEF|nr:SRPBCC domain-containing protein [Nocardioides sp.]HET6654203.1 SRPBCC domain-containing protein [Nocardioides sp.]
MRFSGEREVPAPVGRVSDALHDREVLCSVIPGCEELVPLETGLYAASLAARVGPVADVYRGTFSVEDVRPGSAIRVRVAARGRCGRLDVDLHVTLSAGSRPGTSALRYHADATVRGFVSRLGTATLTVAGSHFTGCFFNELARSLRRETGSRAASLV